MNDVEMKFWIRFWTLAAIVICVAVAGATAYNIVDRIHPNRVETTHTIVP